MAEKKRAPPRALVKREKPKYAVANPGRIVTHPAFWPSPSKHRLCDRVDPGNGKNTQGESQNNSGPIPGRQPATAAIARAANTKGGARHKRLSGGGHKAERTKRQQMTVRISLEPVKSRISEVLV